MAKKEVITYSQQTFEKENAACVAQCLLPEERGQDFANNNNEEISVQNEKLNRILKDMEEKKLLLALLKGRSNTEEKCDAAIKSFLPPVQPF